MDQKEYIKKWMEEHKEEQKEYMKKYHEIHKDYRKNYYETHKDYYKDYYKEYYKIHKEDILLNSEKWREKNKGDFIYKYITSSGEVIYIGSTSRPLIERTSLHLNKHSHLDLSADDMVLEHDLELLIYQDLSKYNLSRDDLYYIENYWKEKEDEILGKIQAPCNMDKLTRSKEDLIKIAKETEFTIYNKLDRYLS